MLTSAVFPDVLDPAVDAIFSKEYDLASADSIIEKFMKVMDVDKSYRKVSAIGRKGKLSAFTGTIAYNDIEQLYDTTGTPGEYADGIQIERKLYDDMLFNDIKDKLADFSESVAYSVEEDVADTMFNNAASSNHISQSGGDGQALLSTAHPYSPSDSSTQDNYNTNGLSHSNLWTDIIAMMNFKDSKGYIMKDSIPDQLWVGRLTLERAYQICATENVPGSANYAANILAENAKKVKSNVANKFGLEICYSPLIDSYNWYLVNSKLSKKMTEFHWRIRPETIQSHESDSLVGKWAVYCRYAMIYRDWRWILGNIATALG